MTLGLTPGAARRRAVQLVWALAAINLGFAALVILRAYIVPDAEAFAEAGLPVPDFAAFWAAGRLALEGTPALAWDWEAHKAVEAAGLGYPFANWMPWHYPPTFQLALAPLGAVPFWPAMVLWVGLMGALYLRTCWRILPGPIGLGAALAAAPTAMTLVNGQTGFLVAALLGLGFLALERRPAAAGVAFGLLSIKPHVALALPVALAAGGRWRAFLVAAAVAVGFALLALAVLGPESWAAFRASIGETAEVYAGDGFVYQRWEMAGNLYGFASWLGLGLGPALALQGAFSAVVLVLVARAWADPATPPALKAALACLGTAAAAPRILNYDLHILVIGGLFQLRHAAAAGHFRGEGAILIAALFAGHLSMLFQPGVTWALAPVLFLACWLGHARNSCIRVAAD